MPISVASKWQARHQRRGEIVRIFDLPTSTVEDARTNTYTRGSGNKPRYVERLYCSDGVTLVSAVRVLAHSTTQQLGDQTFGPLPQGSQDVSVMPEQTPIYDGTRVLMVQRRAYEQGAIVRGAGANDLLPLWPVTKITRVLQGAAVYTQGVDYQLSNNSVLWITANKPAAASLYSIEYSRQPLFQFLGGTERLARVDRYGALMPQRVTLEQVNDLSDMEHLR